MPAPKVNRRVKIRLIAGIAIGPLVLFLPFFFEKEAPDNPPITLDQCMIADSCPP